VPEALRAVNVPKLIIQPLVENAIKHGFHVPPPWRLDIQGSQSGDQWRMTIRDNGIGIEPGARQLLDVQVAKWRQTGRLPPLGIDGMGLFNINVRLRLFFGDQHFFDIQADPQGGTVVSVGGGVDAS
jgi:two-component system sensor histidine kinase YesM